MSQQAPSSVFLLIVSGQIETGVFADDEELFVAYEIFHGPDWQLEGPIQSGTSQLARKSADTNPVFSWNFPIEASFKSTNPSGWPQIVFTLSGFDYLGRTIPRGYGVCHLPVSGGDHRVRVPVFCPAQSSLIQSFIGWYRGDRPIYTSTSLLASGAGRELTRVRSHAFITVQLNVVTKDMKKLGYQTTSVRPESSGSVVGSLVNAYTV